MAFIRTYESRDWQELLPILRATFAAGDTYAFSPDSTEADIHRIWIEGPQASYVIVADDGTVLGTYFIRANQPGLGSHVCNCGYIVAESARGQGLATQLCEHSQAEARRLGYRAMQYNLVVSTNDVAVRLWKKLGYAIVGTLPGAFHHAKEGFVDAYVMFKTL
ncbi:MAG: GNAT family N-acetyltransferase [Rhodothermales bacterium]